jgi:hypothetical protein
VTGTIEVPTSAPDGKPKLEPPSTSAERRVFARAPQVGQKRQARPMNTDNLNIDHLLAAFRATFGTDGRPFGSPTGIWAGVSDNAHGVQWNAGTHRGRSLAYLGVNLEGMEYDGWPIARFIERELAEAKLPSLAMEMGSNDIEMSWTRDAWQASARLPIEEHSIGGTPIKLRTLTAEKWREVLREAYRSCPHRHSALSRASCRHCANHRGQTARNCPRSWAALPNDR